MTSVRIGLPGAYTHQGGRDYQQDAFEYGQTSDPVQYTTVAVADGLGQSSTSDVIARTAVGLAVRIAGGVEADQPGLVVDLTRTVMPEMNRYTSDDDCAGRAIARFADPDTYRAPDTTLVIANVTEFGQVHVGWVGDSRAYILTTGGRLAQLTDDHNMAAFGGPAHIITRTLRKPGGRAAEVSWLHTTGPDRARRLLLCTDGVHGALAPGGDGRAVGRTAGPGGEDEHRHRVIRHVLEHTQQPGRAAIRLVRWAVLAAGESADNATAVVLDIPNPER